MRISLTRQHVCSMLSSCFLFIYWTKAEGIKETWQSGHRCRRHLSKGKKLILQGMFECKWKHLSLVDLSEGIQRKITVL